VRVRYTAGARSDLLQLRRYVVSHFDAVTWRRTLADLHEAVLLLVDHPRLGSVPPELEELGIDRYRELTVGRNRIIYETQDDSVFVLIVVDHRRDFRAVLARRVLEPPTDGSTT
jgi:plasmid stabilization system protein ParE